MKATPAVALQCLGHFLSLFKLLQSKPSTGHLALQVNYFSCYVCTVDDNSLSATPTKIFFICFLLSGHSSCLPTKRLRDRYWFSSYRQLSFARSSFGQVYQRALVSRYSLHTSFSHTNRQRDSVERR